MTDLEPFWLSLRVASVATLLIVAVRMPLAACCWPDDASPASPLLAGILVLPLVLPPTVLGFYLLELLVGARSWATSSEHTLGITLVFHWSRCSRGLCGGRVSAIPAAGTRSVPRNRSDPTLEDVARLLGRNGLSSLSFHINLPARPPRPGGVVWCAQHSPRVKVISEPMIVAGNIPRLTQTASLAIYDTSSVGHTRRGQLADFVDLWCQFWQLAIVQRTLPRRGSCSERARLDISPSTGPQDRQDALDRRLARSRPSRPARPLGRRAYKQDHLAPPDCQTQIGDAGQVLLDETLFDSTEVTLTSRCTAGRSA